MKAKHGKILLGTLTSLLCAFITLTANATNYTLTLNTNGSGTVSRDPTNSSYPSGVTVIIMATPTAGWYFAGWTGDTNSPLNPLNVVMNSNMTVTGNFLQYPTYTLALATNGQGGIGLSPNGGSYQSNTTVTATATPAAGWVFAGWSGAASGTANPISFPVNASGTLTGTFAQLPGFDTEPMSVTNKSGSTVSFTSHSVGSNPLAYTWYFSGGTLNNATSATLTLTNITPAQAGTYWVVATNNWGSATSSVVSLVVTNPAGSMNLVTSPDQGSLQAAIALGGWVGIDFNGTVTLTNTINITNNVVLDGTGVAATISGGNSVQLFNVAQGASLIISNLTLANGNGLTAIYNNGALSLIGCSATNNQGFAGGAIWNNGGTVTLFASTFSRNFVIGDGCRGGAAYQVNGSMMISNCVFSSNSATNTGNGMNNTYGGALYAAGGNIIIARSQFTGNQVSGYGPDWINSGSSAYGGAIFSAGALTLVDSSVAGNLAVADSRVTYRSLGAGYAMGGGIYNAGTAQFNRCSIYSNSVQGGFCYPYIGTSAQGGVAFGAGIYNVSSISATNCTIAFNSAIGGGAGSSQGSGAPATNGMALGGGIFNSSSSSFIAMNLTIAGNACSSPAGQYAPAGIAAGVQIANSNGTFHVHNTLIAYPGGNSNAYGPITDDGYNICSDGSAALLGGSSYNYTDPKLGPLGNYGGPTLCMALLSSSPAIDNADPNDYPGTDQRGYLRPFGSEPDMGAYEYGAVQSTAPNLSLSVSGNNAVLSFAMFPSNTYLLQWSTNLTAWVNLSTNGPVTTSTFITQPVSNQGAPRGFYRLLVQ